MIPLRLKENLGFMLQAPEGLAVGDPVHIPLEAGAYRAFRLKNPPARTVTGKNPRFAHNQFLGFFPYLSGAAHRASSFIGIGTAPAAPENKGIAVQSVAIPIYDKSFFFPLFFKTI
jgi:hypothetical protein